MGDFPEVIAACLDTGAGYTDPSCWRRAFGVMPWPSTALSKHSKRVSPPC